MAAGLNLGVDVSDFVNVSIFLEPASALYRNFGIPLHLGSTPGVIDTSERLRFYTSITAVAQDFGTTAPEYYSALLHFSQSPQPAALYIGRWAQTATHGHIRGATLSAAQKLLSVFTAITSGSLSITIDGTARNLTGINLSGALNLNGVAALIQTALIAAGATGAAVTWNAVYSRFDIASGTTGTASSVGYATAAATGTGVTDLGPLMHLTSVDASAPVVGIAAESLVSAVATLASVSSAWYALLLAPITTPVDADVIAVASFIEGIAVSKSRIFGVTLQNANVLDSTISTDLASVLQSLDLARTFYQFCSSNAYAVASLFARIATVDYEGNNTTITVAYKQQPGVVPETINENQFVNLQAENCNVFARVNNGTQGTFFGKMANGDYIDERVGADWLQNRIQTDVYNLLYETETKIPQTDDGMNTIKAVITAACVVAVGNGYVAPGEWLGPPIGTLKTFGTLPSGFYVFAPSVSTQSQADRYARKSVPFQVCLKLAGAVHLVAISCLLDR